MTGARCRVGTGAEVSPGIRELDRPRCVPSSLERGAMAGRSGGSGGGGKSFAHRRKRGSGGVIPVRDGGSRTAVEQFSRRRRMITGR